MPRATFFNLPEEKRALILRVAMEEFAAHPFPRASVNRIVKRAGIAKGSFYQYFEDKKDLLLYVLQIIGEEKLAYLRPVLERGNREDFFTLLRDLYIAGIRFAQEHPLYVQIGRQLLASRNSPIYQEALARGMAIAQEIFERMIQEAIRRGEVRDDLDVRLMAFLVASLNNLVVEYYTEHVASEYDERLLRVADQFIEFLRRGIGTNRQQRRRKLHEHH